MLSATCIYIGVNKVVTLAGYLVSFELIFILTLSKRCCPFPYYRRVASPPENLTFVLGAGCEGSLVSERNVKERFSIFHYDTLVTEVLQGKYTFFRNTFHCRQGPNPIRST